jgi:surfeit locus 1 family protein
LNSVTARAATTRELVVPSAFAVAGFLILISLGTWQMERKVWKEALIETLTRRAQAAPIALPAKAQRGGLTAVDDEFRRVIFRAQFIHTQEAFVYTAGSALRPDVSGPGYWVLTPARLADGSLVIVNRGFVPPDKLDTHTRGEAWVLDPVDIVGAIRWPEARSAFAPKDDPVGNTWYVRDHLAIATAKNLGEVAPFFIDQEAPTPPGGFPKAGPLAITLRNEHLQYALTWYGLAAVLAVVFVVWLRSRWSVLQSSV